MSNPRFLQLDVFTEKAGGGNPLGVVLDAREGQRQIDRQLQRGLKAQAGGAQGIVLAADEDALLRRIDGRRGRRRVELRCGGRGWAGRGRRLLASQRK